MSQLTAAANFSRMQSRCNASTAGGGGGGRGCCCGGGGAVLMVSTHAATSECPIPSAAYRRISTSRRLRDGRATSLGFARRGLARRGWRAWARCGVAKAIAVSVIVAALPQVLQNADRCCLLLPFQCLASFPSQPVHDLCSRLGGRAGRAAQMIGGKKRLLDCPGDLPRRQGAIQKDAREIRARGRDGEAR